MQSVPKINQCITIRIVHISDFWCNMSLESMSNGGDNVITSTPEKWVNSLVPGRFETNLRKVIFKLISMIGG